MGSWFKSNSKLIKRIALLAILATLFSLSYGKWGKWNCRGPEFCGGDRLEWGWPLSFIEDAPLNSESNFNRISFIFDHKNPGNFILDFLFFFAILFILSKLINFLWKKFIITSPNTGYAVRELNKIISFVKTKKLPIAILLIVLAGIFYQFKIRPRIITRNCAQSAISSSLGVTTKNPEEVRANFERCLSENGLKK